MQHLQPNTILQGGKYRIERMLGQGGFGITYLAEQTLLHRYVAIKEFFLKEDNGREGSSVTMPNTTKQELFDGQKEKFKKEAARMFSIKNDHVIGVHDLFEENGTAYYVMDYVDGENLAERLKRTDKPIPEDEVWLLLPQILDALATVHKEKFCHLDIKPSNIMVDKTGHVKLIDFGASKQMGTNGLLTTIDSTTFAQTPGYAPPEQIEQNKEKIGPWTDFYALGATLYAVLTNKKPPRPSDINDDMSSDKHLALPGLNLVSAKLRELVLRLLNTNWRQRPQSVEEISSILNNSAAINVKPITEHPGNSNKASGETTIVEPVKGKQPVNAKVSSDGQEASSNLIMDDDDTKKLADYNVYGLTVTDSTKKANCQEPKDSIKDEAKEGGYCVLLASLAGLIFAILLFAVLMSIITGSSKSNDADSLYLSPQGSPGSTKDVKETKAWNGENIPMPHLQDENQYVANPDGVLSKNTVDSMNVMLQFLDRQLDIETAFAVVNYCEGGDAFRLAQDIGNKYGVGRNDRGLVLVMAYGDHDINISPGTGLESTLPDDMCGRLLDVYALPHLIKNQPDSAMLYLTRALTDVLRDQVSHRLQSAPIWELYDNKDSRLKNGFYYITGLDYIEKAIDGDNSASISRRVFGTSELACYIEVFNGINASTVYVEGTEVKIPHLEVKKVLKKRLEQPNY